MLPLCFAASTEDTKGDIDFGISRSLLTILTSTLHCRLIPADRFFTMTHIQFKLELWFLVTIGAGKISAPLMPTCQ